MKWFKHMTKAHDDESLSIVVDRAGLQGYGFYWMVLEIIAAQMDEKGVTSVQYPIGKWSKLLQIQPKKARTLFELCEEVGLLSLKFSSNLINVDCPKLLAIKDEHTSRQSRNSGATPERLRCDSGARARARVRVRASPQTPSGGGRRRREKY